MGSSKQYIVFISLIGKLHCLPGQDPSGVYCLIRDVCNVKIGRFDGKRNFVVFANRQEIAVFICGNGLSKPVCYSGY